jgi:cytoskeletal protein RodZ
MVNKKSRPNTKIMIIILLAVILVVGAITISFMATSKSSAKGNTQLVSSKQSAGVSTRSQNVVSRATEDQAASASGENSKTSVQSEESKLKDSMILCASCGGN